VTKRGGAPEEIIRALLEEHGPVELKVSSLEQTWEEGALGRVHRRDVAADLERAGVIVEPPLEGAQPADVVRVSVAPGPARDERRSPPSLGWLAVIPLVLMAVGALGPWAENVFATEQGVDGNGWIVVGAGVAGTILLALHGTRGRRSPLPWLAALAGAGAAAVVTSDFRDFLDDTLVSPAWGLYVAFAGSALLVAVSMALLVRR
jgi:hypothetical protein